MILSDNRTRQTLHGQLQSGAQHDYENVASFIRDYQFSTQLEPFTVLRYFNSPAKPIPNVSGHRLRRVRIAVSDQHAAPR